MALNRVRPRGTLFLCIPIAVLATGCPKESDPKQPSQQKSLVGESVKGRSPHVYDKAKYHSESVRNFGLSEEHAENHTVFFLRWLIEHKLMSGFFLKEGANNLAKFRSGEATIHDVYRWWDCCLVDEMLSEEGNDFAFSYFDFDHGQYLKDYEAALQRSLPSEFHVDYTEDNYQKLRQVIDRRYEEWKKLNKR